MNVRNLFSVKLALFFLIAGLSSSHSQTYISDVGDAEIVQSITDSTLTQEWTGHFGFSFNLPPKARYNKLMSKVNEAGQSEQANFLLSGRSGSIMIRYYTEQRMLPAGYALLDSAMHFYEVDSTGRNGQIYRRVYVLRDQTIEIQILLTEKGQKEYADKVKAIFDSFRPPAESSNELEKWRYGRDPSLYEEGRYPEGGGPTRE